MSRLIEKKCTACELGAPLVPDKQQKDLLKDLEGWLIERSDISKLVKTFKFGDYAKTIKFVNLIAELSEFEDHHPKITVEWGKVYLEWWSHKIQGLHMNDFICAAKSDELFLSIEQ